MEKNFKTDNLDKALAYAKLLGYRYIAADYDLPINENNNNPLVIFAYKNKPRINLNTNLWMSTSAKDQQFKKLGKYTGDIPWRQSLRPIT